MPNQSEPGPDSPLPHASEATPPPSHQRPISARARAQLLALIRKVASIKILFRLQPYDTTTEEGRALERYRRASWTTATSFLSRGLSALTSIVSVPLTMRYLGREQYGMWMAIGSLLTWAVLADFGLARGLQNHLSEAHGKDDEAAAGQHMSTGFFALLGLALLFAVLFLPTLYLIPWESLLKISEPALSAELRPTIAAVVAVFLAQFPLGVVGQAYTAYQRGHVSNLFGIAGSVLSLGILLLVIKLKLGLPYLILASGGFGVLMTLVNLAYIVRDMPFLRPRWSLVSRGTLSQLVKVSTPMLLFQLGALLINEVQILTITRVSGVGAVADYSIFQRVFSVPVYFIAMIDSPYVPMLREAYARGDSTWFHKTFFGLQKYKFWLSVAGGVGYLAIGDLAARLLSGHEVTLGWPVWAMAGVLLIVGCWNGGYSNLFMAVDRLWTLVITIIANGIVTFPLTYWLAGRHGVLGVIVATTAFSLLITSWLMPLLSRDIFRHKGATSAQDETTPSAVNG